MARTGADAIAPIDNGIGGEQMSVNAKTLWGVCGWLVLRPGHLDCDYITARKLCV